MADAQAFVLFPVLSDAILQVQFVSQRQAKAIVKIIGVGQVFVIERLLKVDMRDSLASLSRGFRANRRQFALAPFARKP